MFNIFKKKSKGTELTLKIQGMHCASCAMNIDSALEDTAGVFESNTSYAKGEVKLSYEPEKVSQEELVKVIEGEGYTVA